MNRIIERRILKKSKYMVSYMNKGMCNENEYVYFKYGICFKNMIGKLLI